MCYPNPDGLAIILIKEKTIYQQSLSYLDYDMNSSNLGRARLSKGFEISSTRSWSESTSYLQEIRLDVLSDMNWRFGYRSYFVSFALSRRDLFSIHSLSALAPRKLYFHIEVQSKDED